MNTYGSCASLTCGMFYCAAFILGVSSLDPRKDKEIPRENCNKQHPNCYGNEMIEEYRVQFRHEITETCQAKYPQMRGHELLYNCWTECHTWWPLKHSGVDPPTTVQRDVFVIKARHLNASLTMTIGAPRRTTSKASKLHANLAATRFGSNPLLITHRQRILKERKVLKLKRCGTLPVRVARHVSDLLQLIRIMKGKRSYYG
ncbi:unnamed protein product [Cylicocyclus nassatus]|uniref:Secreted protein n=1 Tax=Cylicocyclus nassatus TaxID=53992 RepID=A0AA36DSH3_CYLNA|nr:unnamed protein product [Cylicocyclus nassatus]